MMIPGSQARMILRFGIAGQTIWRFRRANVRVRAPRIDGTNSEGLPGAVRGNTWTTVFADQFKGYPYESQLPGVAVAEIEVEMVSWDTDQIVYQRPAQAPIWPQRYITNVVIRPNWRQTAAQFSYFFSSLYVEEVPHRIDVKDNQPISFTAYSNGPFRFPGSAMSSYPFPASHN